MRLLWDESAWEDYLYRQSQDKKTLRRINQLIQDAQRNPFSGIGKPEPLKNHNGYWSRRIDETNRLVYKQEGDSLIIAACRGHYDD